MAKLNHPDTLRYAETHEWVRVEGDEAVIGISDYAQDSLGDVVYLDLKSKVGQHVKQGGHFGDVESVKATSELFAPVSGEVVRVNDKLTDASDLVNSDPYGEGWMLAIKMTEPAEVDKLMTAEQYEAFLKSGH
ncbi:MAG TPA: glycine cleavage system protein GcvH [Ktedonobacterales bacterium]|nr:glycine cleavage system protein GcvH [Ktedonobacterales bacterium]